MGVDALVVALHVVTVLVCPLQPVVPLAALGAHPGGFGLSDQPSFPRPSCLALLPVYLLSAGSVWPGRLVGVGASVLQVGCPRHQA